MVHPLSPWPLAIASAIVGIVEQVALNPLTILRSRAFAGRRVPLVQLLRPDQWSRGLPLLLGVQVARNLVGFGLWAQLAVLGMDYWLAGLLAGAADGLVFAPTRRLLFRQHLGAPQPAAELARIIICTEGWRGLWRGGSLSVARTALGGLVYFGVLGTILAALPGMHPALTGALATAACTIAVNPCEVALACVYSGRWRPPPLRRYGRGLGIALARTVPAKALSWWATYGLAASLAGWGAA